MGGGAASSVPSGSNSADLDFNAVQVSDTMQLLCMLQKLPFVNDWRREQFITFWHFTSCAAR